jgi:hypothetical protein
VTTSNASFGARDHDDFGLNQSKIINVINSDKWSVLRAENRSALFLNPLQRAMRPAEPSFHGLPANHKRSPALGAKPIAGQGRRA